MYMNYKHDLKMILPGSRLNNKYADTFNFNTIANLFTKSFNTVSNLTSVRLQQANNLICFIS